MERRLSVPGDGCRYPAQDLTYMLAIQHSPLPILVVVLLTAIGCSDQTLPHREQLATCFLKASGPLDLDFDAIAPEMHRMHMGAEDARRSAKLFEDFLATSPMLDPELLDMVHVYAETQRKLETQFQSAVDAGRPELTPDESEIAKNCALAGMTLQRELCDRIDFNSIVTVSP